ncbi:YqgE/AlgH family protein [Thalassobacterium sedimentorum]|nr:YqgE/AlgH family protein [Coraliomargarita sp. SDUM461004]
MRINRSHLDNTEPSPHAGALLLAHPSLLDPNFRRSVILLTAYGESEGAMGVVVNRPLGHTLGEYDADWVDSPLSTVPLFAGGPVAQDQLILVAWKWSAEAGTFQLYFGIDGEKVQQLLAKDPEFQIRGFLGHAGWSAGQLDVELEQKSWVLSACLPILNTTPEKIDWHELLCHERPDLRLLADAPDDPSLN